MYYYFWNLNLFFHLLSLNPINILWYRPINIFDLRYMNYFINYNLFNNLFYNFKWFFNYTTKIFKSKKINIKKKYNIFYSTVFMISIGRSTIFSIITSLISGGLFLLLFFFYFYNRVTSSSSYF